MLSNSATRYGLVTRTLHWLIAALILGLIGLGWYVVDLGYMAPNYQRLLDLHQSLGMLVLVFALLEIVWHVFSRPPHYLSSLTPLERRGARIAHLGLYAMMAAIPITGYVIATTEGGPVTMFGLFELPAFLGTDSDLAEVGLELHYYFAYGTGILAAVHAAAALKHHFINGDSTLRRMLRGA